ncbi:type-1A angiotensin II receptor [Alosa alosa]|uniref:type-1A angiotensin II receptor n=1 Tax=Alosa alosa TaxID=278164 RepID=UPI00201554BC|nr:type-1A angiotensin II receptor [Alosa alosa]
MSELKNSEYWPWTNNCTKVRDLSLPLVPYMHCKSNRLYMSSVIPPIFYMLTLLGIVGNLGSVWVCLFHSRPWSIGSIGVLNLALCDLAYLVSIVPWAVYMSTDYHWTMSESMCILVKIIYFVGLTSSTMFICAVSVDRFLAIVFPLESRMIRTPRNAVLVSLLLWTTTTLLIYLSYPNIIYRVRRRDKIPFCGAVVISRYRSTGATYNLLSYYSIQVSVPLLLVIPCYVKIMARMKQSWQQWSQGGGGGGSMHGRDKTIWLISVFIANFLVCWVPGQLLHIIACIIFFTLNDCNNTCWMAHVVNLLTEASQLLHVLNACLDPLIYHTQQGFGEMVRKGVDRVMSQGRKFWHMAKKEDFGGKTVEPISVIRITNKHQHQEKE